MSMTPTVERFLQTRSIPYKRVQHTYAETAMGCAIAASIPAGKVAKAVMMNDDQGFMMAIIPADRNVDLDAVSRATNRVLSISKQRDVTLFFKDSIKGAVPGVGPSYNLKTIWDDRLGQVDECYMEAGDHTELINFDHDAFLKAMENMPHGTISH